MQNVDTIACVNNGGFVMKFRATWPGGNTGWSDEYTNPNSRSFNLNNYNIAAGTLVGIEIDIALGPNESSPSNEAVAFAPNSGSTATYQVTGTIFKPHIYLQGPADALAAPVGTGQVAGV